MAKYKNSIGSIILKTIISVVAVVCLALDFWYIYIKNFGTSKTVSNSVVVSDMEVVKTDILTGETVTETKCFIEANMYDNVFEIKFNQLLDESQTAFYSMGLQMMISDEKKSFFDKDIFDGNYEKTLTTETIKKDVVTHENWYYFQKCKIIESYFNQVVSQKNYYNIELHEYQSSDDYETPLGGTALLKGEESFKVQVKVNGNNEVFRLTFKDYNTKRTYDGKVLDISEMTKVGQSREFVKEEGKFFQINHYYETYNYFRAFDISYLAEYIINSVKGLASGFIGESYIKMPDMFNVEQLQDGSFVNIGTINDPTVNLYSETCLFNKIKITVHEGNMTKSSQSIFNKFGDYQNYDSNEESIDMTDYLSGRCLLTATIDDLTWNTAETSGAYTFGLSDEFKTKWKDYSNKAFVKVVIDSEKLDNGNVTYAGFDNTSLDGFVLYQIIETDGTVLYQGVKYA